MIEAPTRIVIVSANAMARAVDAAVRAMHVGALTVLLKPPAPSDTRFEREASELISTVKAMAEVKIVRHHRRVPDAPAIRLTDRSAVADWPRRAAAIRVVAMAASTGGPPALQKLLAGLPRDFPVPILLVQHIGPQFTRGFATWLDSVVAPSVKLASAGETLRPATVYVAPGHRHLAVTRSGLSLALSDEPAIDGFRPSASYLFESVACAFGSSAVGLILTGMGNDGVDGLRKLRAVGGLVLAQDEPSCVVYGMPGAAVDAGLADRVLPLDSMALALSRLVR
jgi:two-component system chemotaxis response regulator CheB